jgi:hypothetical protein
MSSFENKNKVSDEVRLLGPGRPSVCHQVDFSGEAVKMPLVFVLEGLALVLAGTEIPENVLELSLGWRELALSVHYD